MTAMRLARAATGRDQILKFAGAYHGHVDGLLAQAGSGLATQASPLAGRARGGDRRHGRRPLERSRRAARGHGRARARRDHRRADARRTWASCPPRRLPRAAARAGRRQRRAARSSTRSSAASASRRGGAQELRARPVRSDHHRQDHRRRAARRGLRRLARRSWSAGAGRRRLPGGHAVGNPLAVAAGRATLALLDDTAYLRLAATTERLAAGLREAAGGGPVQVGLGAGADDGVLQREAGARLRRRAPPATSMPTRPGAASCSRAACTRRRRSSRPGSRRSPHAEHDRGTIEAAPRPSREVVGDRARARWPHAVLRDEGGLLADVAAPAPRRTPPAELAAAGRERGPARRVRAAGGGHPRGLPAALRPAARGRARRSRPALLAGDRLYAIGLARLADAGRHGGGRRAGRPDHADALAQAPATRAGRRGLGAGRAAVGWGRPREPPAKAHAADRPRSARGDAHKRAERRRGRTLTIAPRYCSPTVSDDTPSISPKYTARPADPGGLRGRDRHAPALHDGHGARGRRDRRDGVHAAGARLRARARSSKARPATWQDVGPLDDVQPTTTTCP